jgi:hypothetical protein
MKKMLDLVFAVNVAVDAGVRQQTTTIKLDNAGENLAPEKVEAAMKRLAGNDAFVDSKGNRRIPKGAFPLRAAATRSVTETIFDHGNSTPDKSAAAGPAEEPNGKAA